MIKGILFDKDDTIIDLATFWKKPILLLSEYINENFGSGDEKTTYELIKASGFNNNTLVPNCPLISGTNLDVVKAFSKICPIDEKNYDNIIKKLEYLCITEGEVKGNDNIESLIENLHLKGYFLGVVTSDNLEPTIHCLNRLNICDYFTTINSADKFKNPKPFKDMGINFLEKTNLRPKEVIMVGDCLNDMNFAKNCGFFGILYNKHNVEKIKTNSDYFEINNLNLITNIINDLDKKICEP